MLRGVRRLITATFGMLFVVATVLPAFPVSAAPGDTEDDPILITNCTELQAIDSSNANYNKHYALANDINCAASAGWDSGKGFNPIASNDEPFTGTFNGRFHTITNLTILRADDDPGSDPGDEQSVGLFAWTQNAEIKNLNVDSSKVQGYEFVGGIVGWAETTDLTNVSFNATVADNSCDPGHCVWARYGSVGGGIVGMLHSSNLKNGVSAGPVKGSGNTIGGLVGQVGNNSYILSSSSSSNIDGGHNLGGAVGNMLGGTLSDVHATGNVDANDDEDMKNGYAAGGLVGSMEGTSSIASSSATGDVHADYSTAGGLVGLMEDNSSVIDSFAAGDVTQSDGWTVGGNVGGLIGELNGGTVARSYASGSAAGEHAVGAFAGRMDSSTADVTVRNSFTTGDVTANGVDQSEPRDGALAGYIVTNDLDYDEYTLENNYYDATRTGMDHCAAGYPAGYTESSATLPGRCIAVNAGGTDNDYFYDEDNQPFFDGDDMVWPTNTWEFHANNYPTLECNRCEVIEDGQVSAEVETLPATNIGLTTAKLNANAQLLRGLNFDDDLGEDDILPAFSLNTSSTVDWDNYTVQEVADWESLDVSDGDNTQFSYSLEVSGLICDTQYWFVAIYAYDDSRERGISDSVRTFTTDPCDGSDRDGVSSGIEDGAPNGGDGNNDTDQDSEQAHVTSLVNPATGGYVTVVVDESCDLSDVTITREDQNDVQDDDYIYEAGFLHFSVTGCEGGETDVDIYYHGVDASDLTPRKYNSNTQEYFDLPGVSLTPLTSPLSGTMLSYNIVDGGQLDIDGEVNGVIEDPVGLGEVAGLSETGFSGTLTVVFIAASLMLSSVYVVMKNQKA